MPLKILIQKGIAYLLLTIKNIFQISSYNQQIKGNTSSKKCLGISLV
jgi:hypothetical protein